MRIFTSSGGAVAAAAVAATLLISGCSLIEEAIGSELEDVIDQEFLKEFGVEDVDIDLKNGSVTLKRDDGSEVKVGATDKLPADWPVGVKLPAGSTLQGVVEQDGGPAGPATLAAFTARGSITDVYNEVADTLLANGFVAAATNGASQVDNDAGVFGTFASDKHTVVVSVSADGQGGSAGRIIVQASQK